MEAEGKAALQPRITTREIDQRCLPGKRPAHTTVAPLTLPWPSLRLQPLGILETISPLPKPHQLGILKMSPPKVFRPSTIPHTSCIHISHGPKMAGSSTKKLERRKRRDIAVSRLEKALFPPQPPMSTCPTPMMGPAKS